MDKEPSEITKLTERIAKDPKSKLFVPLAEEYKKAGDLEMAVFVLMEGLKNNPGYVTARSFLGKLLIEQGDLSGARAEFEEVIKAVPDNLMAQRKLGNLYALQDRPQEALQHYQAVLRINPKDAETAMLVAEAEAGRDIKKHLPAPKTRPAEPSEKQEPAKQAGPAKQSPPPASSAKTAAPAPPPASLEEEPEEVLIVEPLDAVAAAKPAAPQPAGEFDFLAENDAAVPETEAAAGHDDSFGLGAPFAENEPARPVIDQQHEGVAPGEPSAVPGAALRTDQADPFAAADPFASDDAGRSTAAAASSPEDPFGNDVPPLPAPEEKDAAFQAAVTEEQAAPVEHEAGGEVVFDLNKSFVEDEAVPVLETPSEDESDVIAAEIVEEPEKQADDFTTDTLAELYISQGFFEKAIEIYERMLVDNPNSQGLKDKLTHVRSLAAAADSNAGTAIESHETEREPPGPEGAGMDHAGEAPSGGIQPRLDDWELPATTVTPRAGTGTISRPAPQPKPFETGFEPREYVPPDAIPRKPEQPASPKAGSPATAVQQAAGKSGAPARKSPASRKETVERLESWLKNIIKET